MSQKRKKAVALSYDQVSDPSPKVSALGSGKTAERILELAEENDIPVLEDQSLVEVLSQLEVNETIPAALFEVVAEVFAFIYHLDKEN